MRGRTSLDIPGISILLSVTRMMEQPRPYVKVARAAAEERTRTALIDAAEHALFTGVWQSTTLESIAAGARVTKQTLLRHFGSKEGLLETTFQRAYDRVREQRMRAPADDIAAAVDNLLDHYDAVGDASLKLAAMQGGKLITEIGRRARQLHYSWVDHAFGIWLTGLPTSERRRVRAALITICDVRPWSIFVHELGLTRAEVRATLILTVRRLLHEDTVSAATA
jgi:AcrR family transcriptional regulator